MDRVSIDKAILYEIADAIRFAEKSSEKINVTNFADRIKILTRDTQSPVIPEKTPQNGTWQLKNTTDKKYIILGTDDDNAGNAKFFRLLRSYDFPYTMNVEAENASPAKALGSDVDDAIFTEDDVPALFPDGVDVVSLGKYLHESGLGEVAQHGHSGKTLWSSDMLTGDLLTEIYTYYIGQGGTKTEEELRIAIMEQLADTDVAQGASYISESKEVLENAYGFPIYTVGIWGGTPAATIDDIGCSLTKLKNNIVYDWKADGYFAVGANLNYGMNTSIYDLHRHSTNVIDVTELVEKIKNIEPGKAVEFFWHMPFSDEPDITKWRALLNAIKDMVNIGEVEVVTRGQYADFGEWVENPITSIDVSRANIQRGESDSDTAYTVTATYADGSIEDVSEEAIIDRSSVDVEIVGVYTIYATYRGFNATTTISVIDISYTVPEGLKDTEYWFIAKNETQGKLIAGNTTGTFGNAGASQGALIFYSCTDGNINGWTSADNGATWTQVNTNTRHSQNIKTNATEGNSMFYFGNAGGDSITWLETSGNFELNY